MNEDGSKYDPGAIPPDSPASPYRAGVPFHDKADGITYRVVGALDRNEGWMLASFWTHRYDIPIEVLFHFVERGWIDAAFEVSSPVKRFRCRDESKIVQWLASKRPKRRVQIRTPKRYR